MGKYMKKSKTAGEVALMEVAPSSFGVRTRAKTLALQRIQKSRPPPPPATPSAGGSYLQLRSRRLEKSPIFITSYSKRRRQPPKEDSAPKGHNPNPNSTMGSRVRMGSVDSGSVGSVSLNCMKKEEKNEEMKSNDEQEWIEASLGENVLEFEGRERSTRESTPCSLIRDPESIRTPGSTTKPTRSTEANRILQNSMRRHIPTAHEMDEFFASAEEQQLRRFIEKYNFDPVNEIPLPGRYEWVKLYP
ncbi:hypothetical protein U1Q18_030761 [Sarracenia purpurea var. burkii]